MAVAAPSFSDIRKTPNWRWPIIFGGPEHGPRRKAKRNMNTMVTPVNGDNDWSKGGWCFVDVDRDQVYSSGDLLITQADARRLHCDHCSFRRHCGETVSYLLFDGSGFAKTKSGSLGVNTAAIARNDVASTQYSQIRRVKVAKTGRARMHSQTGTDTACSASGEDS